MAKKISFKEVKRAFKDRGYELVTSADKYKNSTSKVKFKCSRHPDKELWISYHKLTSGENGCKFCGRIKSSNSRRTPYENVKNAFEARKYTLLSSKFKNSNTLLEYRCNKHSDKIRTITWGNFKRGKGCRECSNEQKRAKRQKEMYSIVKNAFESGGLILTDELYIDAKTKMNFICPVHGHGEMTYDSVRKSGCRKCANDAMANMQKIPYSEVKKRCFEQGFELLDGDYKNAHQKLNFRCLVHNEVVQKTVTSILHGKKGCQKCGNEKISMKQKNNFVNGIINISLENNPNYKGGTTDLNRYLREKDKLWRLKYLEKYNYSCVVSDVKGGKLQVHHGIPFHEIRDRVLEELRLPIKDQIGKYETLEIESIGQKYFEYLQEVEGFPMTKEIHKLFHLIYGKKGNNNEQVVEFKRRYLEGEFLL